ncbi:MAG: hypothetical protein WDZ38_04650 [Balneolaceae bacterium]
MEIDLTSIIIGIVALSTFFIPIGIHEFSQKFKLKKTRKSFDDAAKVYDLHIDNMEVLRNGFAIGIDTQNHCILHLKNQKETVIELDDIQNCKLFKDLRSETADDGTKLHTVRMGIHIIFKQNRSLEIKLPLFEGKEGSIFGDEEATIQRWIYKIHSVLKESIK